MIGSPLMGVIAASGRKSGGGGGGGGDPLFSSVKYLTNSGSSTDLSSAGTTATDTAISSDGTRHPFASGTSMLFNGSSSKVVLGVGAKIVGEDFTIDGWIYQASRSALQFVWSQYDSSGSGDFANRSILYIDSTGKLGFQRGSDSAGGSATMSTGAWHFVELSRSGGTVYGFLDGVLEFSLALTGNLGNWSPCFGSSNTNPPAGTYWDGNMSPLRVEIGTARHTSGYTPPTANFPTS